MGWVLTQVDPLLGMSSQARIDHFVARSGLSGGRVPIPGVGAMTGCTSVAYDQKGRFSRKRS
jgi:hypothetical protein